MKPKTMILMVVAVACGLGASYMTSRLLAERNNQPSDNMVMVAFAKKKVQAFTTIKKPDELFELRPVPESPLTAKAVKTLEELQGKRLNKPINEENIVRVDDLQRKEDMVIEIPNGQRAIAIKVNPEALAGGFILPGARVDIISTTNRGNEPTSMIILQNMLVVAIDTKVGREDNQSTILGQTVTLAATPEECLRMSLAAGQGDLRLTLRSPEDKRLVTTGVAKSSDLAKPVRDRDGDPNNTEGAGDSSLTVNVPTKLPDLPPLPAPPPQEKPEVKVEEPPPPPPAKTHTLVIQMGENIQRTIFTWDEDNQTWHNSGLSRNLDDDQPGRRPAKKPAPKGNPDLKGDNHS